MSNIRVTYSGLIAFVVGLSSVFTGLIFTLIVTRRLSPEEFGLWGLIGSIVLYFLISEVTISFWAIRHTARGEKVGKTAILSSLLISLGAIPIYAAYVFMVSENSATDYDLMLIGAVLLPVNFISYTLTAINLGHRPQATSFSLLAFEVLKIPFGLVLIVIFELGVLGAIYAVFFAYFGKIIVQLYFARPQLQYHFSFQKLRRWLKLSWVPLYSYLPNYIQNIDVVLFSLLTGSVIGIAYYYASFTVAAIVAHSSLISQAIYPKILSQLNYGGIKENLTLVMYFGIPLLGIAIIFSKPALFALNPAYQDASFIVILLAFKIFALSLKLIPISILRGVERVDVEENPKYSILIKSKLFFIPTILSIFNAVYIGVLVSAILLLNSLGVSEIELVTWWVLIGLIVEVPLTSLFWYYARKYVKFSFPIYNVVKYIGATLVFFIVYFFTSDSIIKYEISIYKFLPSLLLQLAICVGVYLAITYVIDKNTKLLFKSIIKEIFKKN